MLLCETMFLGIMGYGSNNFSSSNNNFSKYFVVTKDGKGESDLIDYDDYGIRTVITISKDLLK